MPAGSLDLMGLFTQQPEDPTEWAGLPSEPERPQSEAERLREAAGVDPAGVDASAAVTSISISLDPAAEPGDE